jgi:anti-anti-sigma factor
VCVGLVHAVTLIDAPPISLTGELDIATTAGLLSRNDLRHLGGVVSIDMSDVTFIDCSALGAIVHLRNDVIAAGGTLRLAGVPAHIASIFIVAGLATIL